jgi:predicted AAA+ superfamily ATPase
MHDLITRQTEKTVLQYLSIFPSVAILGPRQCGKSTLVKMLAGRFSRFIYLDLQDYQDLNRISDPILFFENNKEAVICLDEIQLAPQLFSVLRSAIDKHRRNGCFILLGSASRELLQKSSESLAGRIGIMELSPFLVNEVFHEQGFSIQRLWLRGGFPESYLSPREEDAMIWLECFIRTYLERDIPQLGIQIPALQLRRLLVMCAHSQGQLLNSSKLGESLGLTHTTVRKYIDLFEQTYILRTLQPYIINAKKRLVKSPKIYLRDTGILHRLLLQPDFNTLLGNPVFGASWEGLVIENIIMNMPDWTPYFYRTASGSEIDLILEQGGRTIAIECKASTSPQLTRSWWDALDDIAPVKTFVVAPVTVEPYQLKPNVAVSSLYDTIDAIKSL